MCSNKLLLLASLALCLVLLDIIPQIDARCVCNSKGEKGYCNGGGDSQEIIRPKPKYYDTKPDVPLNPIGDNCWCSKLGIEPAALPKPKPCPKNPSKPDEPPKYNCKYSNKPNYDSYDHNPLAYLDKPQKYDYAPEPSYVYDTPDYKESYGNYVPKESKHDYSPPADPISISLATQHSKAIEVPEAKLSYGYVQKPIDKPKPVYVANVPEEKLYKLNSEVITLHKPAHKPYKKDDEEEYEEPEEEHYDEHGYDDELPPHLTYKQLGYVTEHYKNPKFRKVSSPSGYYISDHYDYDSDKPSYSKPPKSDCGYKPGRVTPYGQKSCDGSSYST